MWWSTLSKSIFFFLSLFSADDLLGLFIFEQGLPLPNTVIISPTSAVSLFPPPPLQHPSPAPLHISNLISQPFFLSLSWTHPLVLYICIKVSFVEHTSIFLLHQKQRASFVQYTTSPTAALPRKIRLRLHRQTKSDLLPLTFDQSDQNLFCQ